MRWEDLSINKKVAVVFFTQLAIIVTISVLAIRQAGTIKSALKRTEETTLALSQKANQMHVNVIQVQQFLTDISATRGLDGLDDGFENAEKNYQSFLSGLAAFRVDYQKTHNAAGIKTTDKLKDLFTNYYTMGKKMAQAYIDQGPAGGNKMMPAFDSAAESLSQSLEPFLIEQKQRIGSDLKSIDSALELVYSVSAVLGVLFVAFVSLALFFLARSISKAVNRSVAIANQLRDGDLTAEITIDSQDEAGKLLAALKELTENLRNIIAGVIGGSEIIVTSSKEIAAGNANLSQRTEEQASSLEETASSMEEMTGTVKQNADSAAEARQLADANRARAAGGAEVLNRTVEAMSEINESSAKIADIITTIDGIAFQTNLLALNAAVEAARAGEQGRGFAVVASEVRSLAQRSAEAAKEIKVLIEDSVSKVKAGTQLVDESGKTLEEIIAGTQKVADIIAEIAAASLEQAAGIDQVNNAVTQMDNMTQDNAALVEEAAAASRSMEEQAANLRYMMGHFKLDSRYTTGKPVADRERPSGEGHAALSAGSRNTKAGPDRTHLEHLKQTRATPPANDTPEWEQF
jgi:methyl-accepting chemotaxis protein